MSESFEVRARPLHKVAFELRSGRARAGTKFEPECRTVSERAVFFVHSAGYEAAWQVASMGLTAAVMGDSVVYVFSFDALRALSKGIFGKPLNDRESKAVARGEGLGAPVPNRMLDEARQLGARIVACDTTVKLCGLDAKQLTSAGKVDEVMGLPSIWKLTEKAKVLSF